MGRFKTKLLFFVALTVGVSMVAGAQDFVKMNMFGGSLVVDGAPPIDAVSPHAHTQPALVTTVSLPRMAPELALEQYVWRATRQWAELGEYSAVSTVRAVLPDLAESGEFDVERHYTAPKTLQFKPVRFTGDGFVKTNVIVRLLQSEVDQIQKDQPAQTAIANQNYKFSYKGTEEINGRLAHVYQVKPRRKSPGLFKGLIFIDPFTGGIARAQGRLVKSPSIFIKNIDFVQDYADFGSFTFPVHMHSEAKARLVGRVIVDIFHRDYRPVSAAEGQSARMSGASTIATASN